MYIEEDPQTMWLPNVMMVKKANGSWKMCVDFTGLNKACPKDSYLLLNIDSLVDATSGYTILSFYDAFSGYNQILMWEEDRPKTTFIIDK